MQINIIDQGGDATSPPSGPVPLRAAIGPVRRDAQPRRARLRLRPGRPDFFGDASGRRHRRMMDFEMEVRNGSSQNRSPFIAVGKRRDPYRLCQERWSLAYRLR